MHSTVSNTQPIQVCRRAGSRMPLGLALIGMPHRNRKRAARHRFCRAVGSFGAAPNKSSTKSKRSTS
eukprot:555365-Pyramimonas_sp.AAC.1